MTKLLQQVVSVGGQLRWLCERRKPLRLAKSGFTLVELFVVIAIIGVIVALLLPAVQAAREAARRSDCQNRLKQLALGMQNYVSARKRLPAGMHKAIDYASTPPNWVYAPNNQATWYWRMGPYIEEQVWADTIDYDKSWSDPANDAPRRVYITLYTCPSNGQQLSWKESNLWARWYGNYTVNWGNTNLGQEELGGVRFGGSPFTWNRGISFAEIIDGTSKTILMTEVMPPLTSDSGWHGPIGDTTVGHFPGVNTYRTPNVPVPDEVWGNCFPITSANGLPGCIQAPMFASQIAAARGTHPGGVLAARCDGSVSFVPNEVDLDVWRGLGSSKGGETVDVSY